MASISSDTTNIADLPNQTQMAQQIPIQQQGNISMSVSEQSQPPSQQNQQYQQQMNHILPLFISERRRNFIVENNGYRYEAFIDADFGITSSGNLGEDERMFTAKATIKILGYLTGNDHNDDEPFIQTKESIVEVKISRERVIVGDSKPWDKSGEKFRDL